jgi:hypothetical protein
MPAVTTIEGLGILMYSHRRENKAYYTHLDHRIGEMRQDLQVINDDHQKGMQHCASHDAMINGLTGRVENLEGRDSSDALIEAVVAKVKPEVQSSDSVLKEFARNKSTPWAGGITLVAITLILALTGRDAKSLNPIHPLPPDAPASTGGTNANNTTINVQAKQ